MNILYTLTSYPPAVGGAQQHFHEIARRLCVSDTVLVLRQWDGNRQDWLLGSTILAPRVEPASIEHVRTQAIGFGLLDRARMLPALPLFYAAPQLFTPWVSEIFLERMRCVDFTPDLVHHGRIGRENLASASLERARELRVPFVLTPFHHPRWIGWRYRKWLELYREADHVFAMTEAERATLQDFGVAPDRITVVAHGPSVLPQADGEAFRRRHDLGAAPLVLFLGHKYEYKGYKQLLDAAGTVWREFPQTRFVFVGPRTRASRRVFARIEDRRLIEIGAVPLEEKCQALSACDVFAMVSAQESFGGVYVEAWMYCKPVVAAKIPAVANVVEHGRNGILVEQHPNEIAGAILELLRDRSKAEAFGRAGHEKAIREYGWDAVTARVRDAYTEIVERHRRDPR